MIKEVAEGIWESDSGAAGHSVCISFGMHGNERAPIEAGRELVSQFTSDSLTLRAGRLLLIHGNPLATEQDRRFTQDGVDLNRCFHQSTLARHPELLEERRAHEIVSHLERVGASILVDFHCIVEPGPRFLMQHPPVSCERHAPIVRLFRAESLLADPKLYFGGVSLDEWMSTRERVGICYETGWIHDPDNTGEAVLEEMRNLLRGSGLLEEVPREFAAKQLLELDSVIVCEGDGFRWSEDSGVNLQSLPAGAVLGAYGDGTEVALPSDATLIFPKKKPELVEQGKPLVFLARSGKPS